MRGEPRSITAQEVLTAVTTDTDTDTGDRQVVLGKTAPKEHERERRTQEEQEKQEGQEGQAGQQGGGPAINQSAHSDQDWASTSNQSWGRAEKRWWEGEEEEEEEEEEEAAAAAAAARRQRRRKSRGRCTTSLQRT